MSKKRGFFIALLIIILFIAFVLWWAYFTFWVPKFHTEGLNNKILLSENTKLVFVTDLPNDKMKIKLPNSIPFWKTIGIVEGKYPGRLWEFTYKGKKYVDYKPATDMAWDTIYRYSS